MDGSIIETEHDHSTDVDGLNTKGFHTKNYLWALNQPAHEGWWGESSYCQKLLNKTRRWNRLER